VAVIRVFVVYESEPAADRYARHIDLCRRVPGATVRHGKVLRTLHGEPDWKYYAEFEFPDLDAFQAVAGSEHFRATGADAAEMGIPHSVYLAEVE
jgi:hypothetical protein